MSMLKAELLKLVSDHKPTNVRYEMDELALHNGHRVLRISQYNFQYNAIDLIWTQIKAHAARRNTSPPYSMKEMKTILKKSCEKVTKDDWMKVVQETKTIMFDDFDRDIRIDTMIDNNMVIHVSEMRVGRRAKWSPVEF
ncbi:putative Y54G2A.42 [Danaus plexippus plexippus]|uniref:Y54G2A.42 n=1 Tax=Danaus plexippus plexippus TaxID=278856 RepID=A0A212EGR7_DANPL|nr:putative Y54G2A.42 [Danaus plexippus plexippus]